MAQVRYLEGVPQVLANLKHWDRKLSSGVGKGLKLAGLMLQRESQKLVPVDLGPLKASAFTEISGVGYGTTVNVGYTAAYALFVHEAVGMVLKGQPRKPSGRGKYWDPQGQARAKFLEEPSRRLAPTLVKIIQEAMRIK